MGGLHFICCTTTRRPGTVGKCWLQQGFGLGKGLWDGLCGAMDKLPAWDILSASRMAAGGGKIPELQNGLACKEPLKVTWAGTPSGTAGDAAPSTPAPAERSWNQCRNVIDKGCTAGARQQLLITHHPFCGWHPFQKCLSQGSLRLDRLVQTHLCSSALSVTLMGPNTIA